MRILIAWAICIGATTACSGDTEPHESLLARGLLNAVAEDRSMVGAQAPAFDLALLDTPDAPAPSDSLASSELEGRVVMLDFWNSGCRPCVEEHNALNDAYARLRTRGVLFLGLTEDTEASFRSFVSRHGDFTYPILKDDGSVRHAYRVPGWPTKVVIDSSGVVVWYGSGGPMTADQISGILEPYVGAQAPE